MVDKLLVEMPAVDDGRKAFAVRPKLSQKMENAGVPGSQRSDNAPSSS
jgi:hypothetical protein